MVVTVVVVVTVVMRSTTRDISVALSLKCLIDD
jgi:hypothetical protein